MAAVIVPGLNLATFSTSLAPAMCRLHEPHVDRDPRSD